MVSIHVTELTVTSHDVQQRDPYVEFRAGRMTYEGKDSFFLYDAAWQRMKSDNRWLGAASYGQG